jgi:hypothetical protein
MLKRFLTWMFRIRAYQFSCACGSGIVARVPKVGFKFFHQCPDCGTGWDMEWTGGGFQTRMVNPMAAENAKSDPYEFYRHSMSIAATRPDQIQMTAFEVPGPHDLG